MYVIGFQQKNSTSAGGANDDIHEYTFSTPFDISTATLCR